MNNKDKLAVLTALEKAVSEEKKKVRAVCDEDLYAAHEDFGVEKYSLKVGETKVGEFILAFSKEGYEITDKQALDEFALDYGFAKVSKSIKPSMMSSVIKFLEQNLEPEILEQTLEEKTSLDKDYENFITVKGGTCFFLDTQEIVPGIKPKPKAPKNTMVRGCAPEVVIPLLRELPGGLDALLLGGGDE